MVDDNALKALQLSRENQQEPTEEDYIAPYVETFIEALRHSQPSAKFTVQDVRNWAVEYQRIAGQELPEKLFNSYSLGKYLRRNHKKLGLLNLSTYGNRQVYGIGESTSGEGEEQ